MCTDAVYSLYLNHYWSHPSVSICSTEPTTPLLLGEGKERKAARSAKETGVCSYTRQMLKHLHNRGQLVY